MPIIKSAHKKMRQDKKRETRNDNAVKILKDTVKKTRTTPNASQLQKAYAALDRAAKKRIIHPNKAARLKSRLAKKIKK